MRRITTHRCVHRRGMALLMAVMMISIVAGSLAALTLSFAAQKFLVRTLGVDAPLGD